MIRSWPLKTNVLKQIMLIKVQIFTLQQFLTQKTIRFQPINSNKIHTRFEELFIVR